MGQQAVGAGGVMGNTTIQRGYGDNPNHYPTPPPWSIQDGPTMGREWRFGSSSVYFYFNVV